MAFTKDKQGLFIGDWRGIIKLIKWKHNATTEQDFESNSMC